jgi:hypothetical protein
MSPFKPQSLKLLRERIPAALERAYGVREKVTHPTNILDLESGLRLIVSRRVIDIGCEPCLHVAATIIPGTMVYEAHKAIWLDKDRDHGEWFKRLVIGQFQELHPTPLEFLGFADGGVPHFFCEIPASVLLAS